MGLPKLGWLKMLKGPLAGAPGCTYTFTNRGQSFHSYDGSSLTFLADSNITDNAQSLGNVTGTLYFPNGTRYRIDGTNGEFVSKITDRNGNQSLFWCIGIFPVKSPKPEKHAGVFSSL
jgi:hypothetical protein